ncbi:MAG TPA: hypothetical protein VFB28_03315 [Terriglobales bacterium]|nr:hypothetical protein [Terriglobales bacterium]
MRNSAVIIFLVSAMALPLLLGVTACSSGKAVNTANYPVPGSIAISPSPSISMELGTNTALTTSILNTARAAITEPVIFVSSDTSVVTVAANGLVCAGSWDNLASPTSCTPGRVGTAQVTATAQGVSSPPVTVYVHQHIDSVTVQDMCSGGHPVPACTLPRNACQSLLENSAPQNTIYEAHAFSRGTDITGTVGGFTWQAVNGTVATLSSTAAGLNSIVNGTSLNQVMVTAKTPGVTPVFASVGTATSIPISFTTCLVQSIQLQATGSTGTSRTIIPTVRDTVGNVISDPTKISAIPLTWSSSQPGSVTVSSAGSASGTTGGGGSTIVVSCTPPTCNVGVLPTLPIYPENAIQLVLNPSATTSSTSVYVGSTGCGTIDNCVSTLVPVTTPNTVGSSISLPETPNSLVFHPQGTKAYLGTDSGLFGSRGLMILDQASNTITQFPSTPGKVLAVSPDGSKVVVSDTTDTPNQVFVFDTVSNASSVLNITGATAADFSPDSLKAYIVAGSTLYVYSKLDALQAIHLSVPANDVSFFAEGAFAYLAGGDPAGVMVRRTCDNGQADSVATTGTPTFIRALPDAVHVLALDPPNVNLITANTAPQGCTPPVTDTVTSFSLGLPSFTASQLIISGDGSTAYILSPNLDSVQVFNIGAQTSSSLPLAGNATPLRASLTSDGSALFVGASDGMLHEIQTGTGADITQIQFPLGLCLNTAGQKYTGITCNPDLVVVKP